MSDLLADIDAIFSHVHGPAADAAALIARVEATLDTLPADQLELVMQGIAKATADKKSAAVVVAAVLKIIQNAPALAALL